jgi:16S rRNA (cytosine1402-N4)-methyltransferase
LIRFYPQISMPHHLSAHQAVLLDEAVDALVTCADGVYLDGTFGRGGHSSAVLARLSSKGRLVALDRDVQAIAASHADPTRSADLRFSIHHTPFSRMAQVLATLDISQLHGVLLDLGVSSPQIDTPERGFSFRFDGPLDMRMDTTCGESAADFLARAPEQQIAEVIKNYGQERFAKSVARAIVQRREAGQSVHTTTALASLVAGVVRTREPGQNPATRTFQALRIFVNAELQELELGLQAALSLLVPSGRLVVISFHSLEDRIVKTFIGNESKHQFDRRAPFAPAQPSQLKSLGRIKPRETQIQANPRARSAVMRVAERTAVNAQVLT